MIDHADKKPSVTPLHDLHRELEGRMVEFAGYEMAVQYPAGILAEHLHTRAEASLFDVSHMGQVRITGDNVERTFERLTPGGIVGLEPGQLRYTVLTNDHGGIIDDLMVTRTEDGLTLVVNASRKRRDMLHLRERLKDLTVELLGDRALIALQGPAAAEVLSRHAPEANALAFMTAAEMDVGGIACSVSRAGYTGEDGFEISAAGEDAEAVARLLLEEPEVKPAGLGARDTLRLEAGLCLYGNDISESTTPIEAGLAWTIPQRRRDGGNFPGAGLILDQLAVGPEKRRVGLRLEGQVPARQHAAIIDGDGETIGEVTSGGFGPTAGGPIAMGYIQAGFAAKDTRVGMLVRGSERPAYVTALPFVPHRYLRNQ